MKQLKGLDLLGLKVKDKVTGQIGIVTSISFDLYGCVQALVHPGLDKDRKLRELSWFDVQRLQKLTTKALLPIPSFAAATGPERKPVPRV